MGQEAHLVLLLDMKVSQKQCRYLKFLKLSFSIVLDLGILGVLKIIRQHLEGGRGGVKNFPKGADKTGEGWSTTSENVLT